MVEQSLVFSKIQNTKPEMQMKKFFPDASGINPSCPFFADALYIILIIRNLIIAIKT